MTAVPLSVRAEEHHETITDDQAKELIATYENSIENIEESVDTDVDERYVNEMILNQEQTMKEIEQKIEEAKENGEKLYTQKEILHLTAQEVGISKEDMQQIKQSIKSEQEEAENFIEAFKDIGEGDHPIVQEIEAHQEEFKIPLSLVYIDHNETEKDGTISGGGWPYCLDDNGYGYKKFITSDCYKALVYLPVCMADSTLGKKWPNLRYCKAYKRNCSPVIGHSKYWHKHAWWQQIP
ncbi:hypothetical protein [Bacillus haynesii]|uniref:Uncharacterized protein n=2 Tax=Bacillus haynesii TaxID=1925021 RepID=A0AA90EU29_9BACI|nr:hypothetical protein [Bacillus haynesii]MCY7791671.1 hypothetical protein [Bacillus haynesii]MCY9282133.1 hypothetical protein [Bacillus haynesii]MCY9391448.1 hypothetical protein [Bacillus haynesii]